MNEVKSKINFDWEELVRTEPTVLPIIDIIETNNEYILKVYMPGVKKEDIFLKLEDDILTIFGRVNFDELKDTKFILREKNYGHYFRRFEISNKIVTSNITAKLDNGLLNVIFPKHESMKPKEISIS